MEDPQITRCDFFNKSESGFNKDILVPNDIIIEDKRPNTFSEIKKEKTSDGTTSVPHMSESSQNTKTRRNEKCSN